MVRKSWGVMAAAMCTLAPLAFAFAQNPLLGQRARQLDMEPPRVQIWLQDDDNIPFGAPVRVAFMVEDDAYVVVARMDVNGNLTVLFPTTASGRQDVAGNATVHVRTIPDGFGTSFYAHDRGAGLGFVFALASAAPFDLSRLDRNEFERTAANRQVRFSRASRRIADPSRVVDEFGQRIQFNRAVPFSAAAAFYTVDQSAAYYSRASSYSRCDAFTNPYQRLYGIGAYRSSFIDDCRDPYAFSDVCFYSGFGAYGFHLPYCFYSRGTQVGSGPALPPRGGPATGPINPWVVDSITPPTPPVVDSGFINGPHIMRPVENSAEELEGRNLRGTIPWRGRGGSALSDPFAPPGPGERLGPAPLPASRAPIENRRGPDAIERPSRGNPRVDESDRLPQRGRLNNGGSQRDDVPRPQPRTQETPETRADRPFPARRAESPPGSQPDRGRTGGNPSPRAEPMRSQPRNDPSPRPEPIRSAPRNDPAPRSEPIRAAPRNDPPPRPEPVRVERPSPPPRPEPVRVERPSPPPRQDPPSTPPPPPTEKKPGGGSSQS